ncbi:MAG: GIY-YIG nuclease family protein [Myxococcales bacterium]|nr:GIY-YIG nuclease family protein [Myxococcales bacterium]
MSDYYVYVLANRRRRLYTGVTNDLERRVWEHKHGVAKGFTKRYNINRLVYFEDTSDPTAAIEREKQIKGRLRAKKVALIESMNPEWKDLSEPWLPEQPDPSLRSG